METASSLYFVGSIPGEQVFAVNTGELRRSLPTVRQLYFPRIPADSAERPPLTGEQLAANLFASLFTSLSAGGHLFATNKFSTNNCTPRTKVHCEQLFRFAANNCSPRTTVRCEQLHVFREQLSAAGSHVRGRGRIAANANSWREFLANSTVNTGEFVRVRREHRALSVANICLPVFATNPREFVRVCGGIPQKFLQTRQLFAANPP